MFRPNITDKKQETHTFREFFFLAGILSIIHEVAGDFER